jgi:hypothetical protein
MLQLASIGQRRHMIAGLLLHVVLIVVLPASWLHRHDHVKRLACAQVRTVESIQWISVASAPAEDDHCTFCSHAWPGCIANDHQAFVFSPLVRNIQTPVTRTCVYQVLVALTDGRAPPMLS